MILLTNSVLGQYPIVKKIGNDSVVIMTMAQGRKINELFDQNEKQIVRLKDSVTTTHKIIDSLRVIRDTIKVERDTLTSKYLLMKSMYQDMKWRRDTNLVIYNAKEAHFNKTIKFWQFVNIGYMIVMFTTMMLIRNGQ